jgi:hypothetical protein
VYITQAVVAPELIVLIVWAEQVAAVVVAEEIIALSQRLELLTPEVVAVVAVVMELGLLVLVALAWLFFDTQIRSQLAILGAA